eukprot:1408124-Rhodomonas_salina.1
MLWPLGWLRAGQREKGGCDRDEHASILGLGLGLGVAVDWGQLGGIVGRKTTQLQAPPVPRWSNEYANSTLRGCGRAVQRCGYEEWQALLDCRLARAGSSHLRAEATPSPQKPAAQAAAAQSKAA